MSKKNVTKMAIVIAVAVVLLIVLGLIIYFASPSEEGPASLAGFFEDLTAPEILPYVIGCIVVVLAAVIALITISRGEKDIASKWTTKELIVGALCIALAFVLFLYKNLSYAPGRFYHPCEYAAHIPVCIYIWNKTRHCRRDRLWTSPDDTGCLYCSLGPGNTRLHPCLRRTFPCGTI